MLQCCEESAGPFLAHEWALLGIAGRITEIGDQYMTVQVATVNDKPVEISMQRGAVQTLLPKGTLGALATLAAGALSKDK